MSNIHHLSASQRQIVALQSRIAQLEQMQAEYNAVLNYFICVHGKCDDNLGSRLESAKYVIFKDKMKLITPLPIKSTISADGNEMLLERVSPIK